MDAIDTSRPLLPNADGSFSTERTITVEADGRHYLLPTIVGGKQLSEEDAIGAWERGTNKPVGVYRTAAEADAEAKRRSAEIGRVRGLGMDENAGLLQQFINNINMPRPGGTYPSEKDRQEVANFPAAIQQFFDNINRYDIAAREKRAQDARLLDEQNSRELARAPYQDVAKPVPPPAPPQKKPAASGVRSSAPVSRPMPSPEEVVPAAIETAARKEYPLPDKPQSRGDWMQIYRDTMNQQGEMPTRAGTRLDDRSVGRDVILPWGLSMLANSSRAIPFAEAFARAGGAALSGANQSRDALYADTLRKYIADSGSLQKQAELQIGQDKFDTEQGQKLYEEGVKARGQDMMSDRYADQIDVARKQLQMQGMDVFTNAHGTFLFDKNTGKMTRLQGPAPSGGAPKKDEFDLILEAAEKYAGLPDEKKKIIDEYRQQQRSGEMQKGVDKLLTELIQSAAPNPAGFNQTFNEMVNNPIIARRLGALSGGSGGGVPPPAQRKVGQVYDTPKGPLRWTGTGWLLPN